MHGLYENRVMSNSPHVIETGQHDFEQAVIARSHEVPVLVDFWAEWCGPCKMQLPILLRLADAYQGHFVLAKVNTDVEQELAARFGIRSIPTMKLFVNGEVVEEITGAQTESALRELLDRHIERESDMLRHQALEKAAAGDRQEALRLLREAGRQDPDNPRIAPDFIRVAIDAGELEAAQQALAALPISRREDDDIRALRASLELARQLADAPPLEELERRVADQPDDLQTREALAARLAADGRYEDALDQYLEILKRDRDYNEGAARKGMLAIFELLGNQGDLVSRYRRRLAMYLY